MALYIPNSVIFSASKPVVAVGGSPLFWVLKRTYDIVLSLMLLPLLLTFSVALLVLNPFSNRGPLIFRQARMGRDCQAFKVYKFRTMNSDKTNNRGPSERLEVSEITKLGKFLRKTRIDELPQILNVLQGQMSLIGPRPDIYRHGLAFARVIPEYRERHRIRPGISGLAQIELGYAQGFDETLLKARTDLHYIQNANFLMELRLIGHTILTILTKAGV